VISGQAPPRQGKQSFDQEVRLDQIPVYARAGSVVPLYPIQQYVSEIEEPELTLKVFYIPEGSTTSFFYEDAGEGTDYQTGKFNLRRFEVEKTEEGFRIRQEQEGNYLKRYASVILEITGMPEVPARCMIEHEAVDYHISDHHQVRIKTHPYFEEVRIFMP
jgi:alpha-glucosidase